MIEIVLRKSNKKQKQVEIKSFMDEIISLMRKGYTLDEAAVKLDLDPSTAKGWYDKGWHGEGDFYIDFFKTVRAFKYSKKSSRRKKLNNNSEQNNLSQAQKDQVLNRFNYFLKTKNEFIDVSQRKIIKKKFNTPNHDYFRILKFGHLIDKHNQNFIDSEKKIIESEFNEFLSSNNSFIDKEYFEKKYKKSIIIIIVY